MAMDIARLVLEFLRVLTAWPVAVFVLVVVCITKFKIPITALINRIAAIRLPGGGELLTPQADQNLADRALRAVEATTEAPATGAPENDSKQAVVADGKEHAALWEYRYLNYYLVPRTQWILDWLASRKPISVATFDSWLIPVVYDPIERAAIFDALRAHHLIRVDDGMISVSEKGREYLQWRGPREIVAAAWASGRGLSTSAAPPPATVSPNAAPLLTDPDPEPSDKPATAL